MTWTLNKLEKTSEVEYIPGSPAIPAVAGVVGVPAYTYWEPTYSGGATQILSWLSPQGWDYPIYDPYGQVMGGSGGYRFFDGVKCSLISFSGDLGYTYSRPGGTVTWTEIEVPAVAPVAAVPGSPATEAQFNIDYRLGWNSGAVGPATLAVGKVVQWRFSAGDVGAVVGITRTVEPQDQGYFGMEFAIMATSGLWVLYQDGSPITSPVPFDNVDTFALHRKEGGEIVVAINGGVVWEDTVTADDVIVDASLYSAGDVIWDTREVLEAAAVINTNISGSTLTTAEAVESAIAITRTVGPGTAIGICDATTLCGATVGAVLVNGSVYIGPPVEPPPPPPPVFG